ncbi:hypothetical protein [Methylopila sp. M107]|uniref:hypothetical protein n=1 Tax=Methylopila sp. M107 TaxID=1101190 RepID=UPI000363BDA9|nr:hypothetical protein [Methylopila sp. M107]
MLPGLLDTRLKGGTKRDEVLALLGEPDSTSETTVVYYLGRSPYGVDFETLEIAFDAEGRLTSAAMRRS